MTTTGNKNPTKFPKINNIGIKGEIRIQIGISNGIIRRITTGTRTSIKIRATTIIGTDIKILIGVEKIIIEIIIITQIGIKIVLQIPIIIKIITEDKINRKIRD